MNTAETQAAITQVALAAGVDPKLALALAKQESRFNQSARSPKGAVGVFQLMPATAADMGVDPFDPAQNIAGGVEYLRRQLVRFGDTKLALAAYNAGPGAVTKYQGVPPYAETQNYVARIMADAGYTGTAAGPDATPEADYMDTTGQPADTATVVALGVGVGALAWYLFG